VKTPVVPENVPDVPATPVDVEAPAEVVLCADPDPEVDETPVPDVVPDDAVDPLPVVDGTTPVVPGVISTPVEDDPDPEPEVVPDPG